MSTAHYICFSFYCTFMTGIILICSACRLRAVLDRTVDASKHIEVRRVSHDAAALQLSVRRWFFLSSVAKIFLFEQIIRVKNIYPSDPAFWRLTNEIFRSL